MKNKKNNSEEICANCGREKYLHQVVEFYYFNDCPGFTPKNNHSQENLSEVEVIRRGRDLLNEYDKEGGQELTQGVAANTPTPDTHSQEQTKPMNSGSGVGSCYPKPISPKLDKTAPANTPEVIICPICDFPMSKLEEWDSNLKMTKIYRYGCDECGAILEFKDYERKYED